MRVRVERREVEDEDEDPRGVVSCTSHSMVDFIERKSSININPSPSNYPV